MTDVSATISPKSNQLNADDLISGPRTITITKVSASGSAEQPIAINFEGDDGKPYMPCKSMRRVLVHLWGNDGHAYVGRALQIYRDPAVKFGGIQVGGIRISHMSHIDQQHTMALTETRASRKPFTVKPLASEAPASPPPPPKRAPTDMNGPTLALVNTKGVVSNVAPAKWRSTLEKWFADLPFDTARGLYDDNAPNIDAARTAGFIDDADAVTAAWRARQAAAEQDDVTISP